MAFLTALECARLKRPVPLLSYSIMPNHFHLVVGPVLTPLLSAFMHRFLVIQTRDWRERRGTRGGGHVYQGPYKDVAIEDAAHFLTVCRYVERNPLEAGLVKRAEDWPWSSLHANRRAGPPALSRWPVPRPTLWVQMVNEDTSFQDAWG
jgi:putative transposase